VSALERNPQGDYTYSGAQRFYASSVIDGSNWRAVTATTTGSIYPALAGSKSWILYVVLVAFALVGGASVLFFWRALSAGHALRNANDELVGVNATLEGRVADRTAAAEERARELARSNEELEQFSSIASHDLQEPLRKVRMFGDRLRETLGSDISEDAAGDLDRMQNAAERMQRLINDLLEFSRVTHRGNAFEQVELSQVAEEVIADLEARVVELDATIELSELPAIDADRTQMRQLMQNLIANALKFHRPDVAPVVRIQSNVIVGQTPRFAGEAVPSDRCVITVEDNGIGFDEKHAERIFAAFERLHGRSAYEGTGIGLSIARKIAWRHGGQIVATGVPGQGSVFTVILPLTHTPSPNGGEKR
jgi:light-regulated signal transduction histidine kinase (bacteriophytochrome)